MAKSMLGLLVGLLLSVSVPAFAQYHGGDDPVSGELDGALRFNVETSIFRYARSTQTFSAGGVELDGSQDASSYGTPAGLMSGFGNMSLGLGYAVMPSLVIGGSLQLGYDSISDPKVDDSSFSLLSFGFAPYIEYLGGESSTKPFIGATLYVRHAEFSGGDATDENSLADTLLGGGLIGGGHFFVSKGCSIDLTGKVTYGFSVKPDDDPAVDTSLTVLDVLITLGVSAWIL